MPLQVTDCYATLDSFQGGADDEDRNEDGDENGRHRKACVRQRVESECDQKKPMIPNATGPSRNHRKRSPRLRVRGFSAEVDQLRMTCRALLRSVLGGGTDA